MKKMDLDYGPKTLKKIKGFDKEFSIFCNKLIFI